MACGSVPLPRRRRGTSCQARAFAASSRSCPPTCGPCWSTRPAPARAGIRRVGQITSPRSAASGPFSARAGRSSTPGRWTGSGASWAGWGQPAGPRPRSQRPSRLPASAAGRARGREERRAGQRVLRRLSADRTRARADLNEALDSPRYPRILEQLEAFLSRPPASAADVSLPDVAATEVEAPPEGGPEAARAAERGRPPRGAHQGQARPLRGRAGARGRGRARQAIHQPGQEAARHPWRSAGRCGNRTVSSNTAVPARLNQ